MRVFGKQTVPEQQVPHFRNSQQPSSELNIYHRREGASCECVEIDSMQIFTLGSVGASECAGQCASENACLRPAAII